MKIKKIMSLLAAATMAVTALTGAMTASAETVAEGTCGPLEWTLDSEGKLTISGEGGMASPGLTDISQANGFANTGTGTLREELETQLKDYPEIYTYKEYKDDIKEVEIKEGVKSIGFAAFYKFPNLEKVTLPSTIEEFKGIGYSTQINAIDTHGHANIQAYASLAFAECKKLNDLTLTEGMTAIGSIAFYGCTALESVRIPSTILYEYMPDGGDLKASFGWGAYSFVGCSSLKTVTLPEGLTVIGGGAFDETGLRSVVIPSTIENWANCDAAVAVPPESNSGKETKTDICSNAFAKCTRLSSVTFAEGLKTIGDTAFWGCTSLKKVAIPKSVTSMKNAFAYCTGLEEVCIEDGAIMPANAYTESGIDLAFNYCQNLKRLEIPAGVSVSHTNPRWNAGCTSLTDIYLHAKDCTMYIPDIGNTPNYHCYFDTDTYNRALVTQSKIPEDRIVNIEEEIAAYLDMVKTSLDKAKTYDEELYTPESYGVLKALIEKAESFGEDASILAMEWTASDITSAIRNLEKKPEETPSDPSDDTSDPSDSSEPSETSSDPASDDSSNNPSDDKTQPTSAPTTAKPAPTPTAPTTAAPKVTTPNKTTTVAKPAKVTKLKVTAKKKKLNVSWKKVSGATGYEVVAATNNKFTKNKKTVNVKKNKAVIKKLKAKKKYFVKVRAYKTVNGTKYYGKWSKVVKKKTK